MFRIEKNNFPQFSFIHHCKITLVDKKNLNVFINNLSNVRNIFILKNVRSNREKKTIHNQKFKHINLVFVFVNMMSLDEN